MRYYTLIFGSQQVRPDPDFAHSFATFVEVADDGAGDFQHHTISWLPESGVIRTPKWRSEPGRNYRLHETIDFVRASNQRISMWGPYEIGANFYGRLLKQFEIFENRKVAYKAVDCYLPNFLVSNCIHAVSGAADATRLRVLIPTFGEMASWYIARRFRRWFIEPRQRHYWVANALGLGQYPIICRDMLSPRSGPLWTMARRILGRPLSHSEELKYLAADETISTYDVRAA